MNTAANCCCSAVGMHRARWANFGRRAARRRALFWQKERKRGGWERHAKTIGTGGRGRIRLLAFTASHHSHGTAATSKHATRLRISRRVAPSARLRWAAAHSIASPQQEGGKRDIVRERSRSERGACATATRATATAMRTTATATTTSATSTATQATDEATATTALAATATATSTTATATTASAMATATTALAATATATSTTATSTETPAAECDSVGEDKRTSAMARGTIATATATTALAATATARRTTVTATSTSATSAAEKATATTAVGLRS